MQFPRQLPVYRRQLPVYSYKVVVREFSETGFQRSKRVICHAVTEAEARHYAAKEIARLHCYRHNHAQALAAIGTVFHSALPPYLWAQVTVVPVLRREKEMEWETVV